jgi:hypothetical protein
MGGLEKNERNENHEYPSLTQGRKCRYTLPQDDEESVCSVREGLRGNLLNGKNEILLFLNV